MTNAKTEVKRFWINTQQYVDSQGPYVNYEDYEAAESRIRALEEVVRELMESGSSLNLFYKRALSVENYSKWAIAETKALALLSSEGATGEGK